VTLSQVTLVEWDKILPLQAIRAWPIRAWSVDRFPSAPSFWRAPLSALILTAMLSIFKAARV
jgi:hypothetical protein